MWGCFKLKKRRQLGPGPLRMCRQERGTWAECLRERAAGMGHACCTMNCIELMGVRSVPWGMSIGQEKAMQASALWLCSRAWQLLLNVSCHAYTMLHACCLPAATSIVPCGMLRTLLCAVRSDI